MKRLDSKERILIYTHEFVPLSGGIATYNVELAQGLSSHGYDVTVLAPHYEHIKAVDDKEDYLVWRPFADKGFKPYKVLISMLSLIVAWLKFHPDLILATNKGSHRCLSLVSLLLPLPYILVIHGSEIVEHFAGNKLMRYILRRMFLSAKAIIVVSQSTKNLLVNSVSDVASKTYVIHHGIRDAASQHKQARYTKTVRTRLKLDAESKIILTVARLAPDKGQDEVILAMPEVLRVVPNARYLIVGGGPCESSLKSLAEQSGVADSVYFLGDIPRDAVWPFYAACDVFVMPSRRGADESFGIVFVEAAAFARPAIAGNQGGMAEAVADGRTGLLVDPTCTSDIAQAIVRLLTDPELANQIGQRARIGFEERFSIETMIEKTVDVIESVK